MRITELDQTKKEQHHFLAEIYAGGSNVSKLFKVGKLHQIPLGEIELLSVDGMVSGS